MYNRTVILITRGRDSQNVSGRDAQTPKGHVGTQREGGYLQATERDLKRNQTCQHLELGLLASRTVRNKFLLFKPPSLWYFIMAALANEYTRSSDSPDMNLLSQLSNFGILE